MLLDRRTIAIGAGGGMILFGLGLLITGILMYAKPEWRDRGRHSIAEGRTIGSRDGFLEVRGIGLGRLRADFRAGRVDQLNGLKKVHQAVLFFRTNPVLLPRGGKPFDRHMDRQAGRGCCDEEDDPIRVANLGEAFRTVCGQSEDELVPPRYRLLAAANGKKYRWSAPARVRNACSGRKYRCRPFSAVSNV